ncbi:MAG: 1-deoxy-D-xylulose-5-phosphate reductoisomerase [Planctomycetota bacterium]
MKTQRSICLLGGTGSIGSATVDVVRGLQASDPSSNWQIRSISGHRNLGKLAELVGQLDPPPEQVILSDPKSASGWTGEGRDVDLAVGEDALVAAAEAAHIDTVVAAIVGRAGLESTLAAVRAGKRVALANKETLVVAGPVVTDAAALSGSDLLPVDSEHSAIFQCLAESRARARSTTLALGPEDETIPQDPSERDTRRMSTQSRWPGVKRLILTASGGPFRDWTAEQMREATVDQALAHPTWQMGRKITIDSATMMNKALEVIEARWLFDFPADAIEVMIHPQSLIHSLVEFDDGSVVAQVSPPDMRLPIQYALTYPRRLPCPATRLDHTRTWEMSLHPAEPERFPALTLGFEVAAAGGTAGAVLNGANETAVGLFLAGKIRFTDICELCRRTLQDHDHESSPTLERLVELDLWSRQHAAKLSGHDAKMTK